MRAQHLPHLRAFELARAQARRFDALPARTALDLLLMCTLLASGWAPAPRVMPSERWSGFSGGQRRRETRLKSGILHWDRLVRASWPMSWRPAQSSMRRPRCRCAYWSPYRGAPRRSVTLFACLETNSTDSRQAARIQSGRQREHGPIQTLRLAWGVQEVHPTPCNHKSEGVGRT